MFLMARVVIVFVMVFLCSYFLLSIDFKQFIFLSDYVLLSFF
ncbi:Uncharacterised protein [Yersinia kristensenii]|nr:hypothetical protein ykris0001_32880 [Yersinia kristensenii ATCC 33638]SUP69459.1 Uncharacterised protein [Yersinia kristensenii]